MKTIRNELATVFEDIEDLVIETDNDGLVGMKGTAYICNTTVKITIHRRKDPGNISLDKPPSKKPLYSGTISILDLDGSVLISEVKKRRKIDANLEYGKDFQNKDIYASITFRCNSADTGTITQTLRRQVDSLILENSEQINAQLSEFMPANQLTPMIAFHAHLDLFLTLRNPNASPEANARCKNSIQRVFTKLQNQPMCRIHKKAVRAIIDENNISQESIKNCYLFWEHLLRTGKCSGTNPFPAESTREESLKKKEDKAFTSKLLTKSVFEKVFELIYKRLYAVYCALVLLLSGFTVDETLSLHWNDIEFVDGYDDFAIIHIRKEYLKITKHDFSRPAIPDSAAYLKYVYDDLCSRYGADAVGEMYVSATDPTANEPLDRKALNTAANDILVRAGYIGRLSSAGRPGDRDPIPISLLRSNYKHMLRKNGGLQNDDDTYHFLCGTQHKGSTYNNYESHTSPEAQYRLYTILKSISVERRLNRSSGIRRTKEEIVYTGVPKTNHEVVQIIGGMDIPPGTKVRIRCAHGLTK